MPTANLGRIGFVNKGNYVGGTTVHKVNDIRKYNNSVYVCIQAHNTEHLPTDVLYWQVWVDAANYYVKSEVDSLVLTEVGAPIASASTINVGGVTAGDVIHITGTTTIGSLGLSTTGTIRTLIFDGVLTITNHSTSLILPGLADVLTVAGTSATFVCENGALGYWRCTNLTNSAVSMVDLQNISTLTSNAQDQLIAKAPLASPTFTGTVVLPATTSIGTITYTELSYIDGLTSSAQTQINARLPLTGGTMTGAVALAEVSTAPTATLGTNTTQIASTAFVLANSVSTVSPAFTGTPTAPTAPVGTNTTQIATTAGVKAGGVCGTGQTAVDVTGSRALGTVYTNTTGRPIIVIFKYTAGGVANTAYIQTAGATTAFLQSYGAVPLTVVSIIPTDATYLCQGTGGALTSWIEIR